MEVEDVASTDTMVGTEGANVYVISGKCKKRKRAWLDEATVLYFCGFWDV